MTYEEILEMYNESSSRGMIPVCILYEESEEVETDESTGL